MERFDANVGSFDRPLQETPEILQPVRVHRAVNVSLGVVDYLMFVVPVHALIGAQFVRVKGSSLLDVLADRAMYLPFAAIRDSLRANLPGFSLQQTENDGFAERVSSVDLALPLIGVHIAGRATDVSFVGFDRASHLVDAALVLRISNS